jgi:hypothetical protein
VSQALKVIVIRDDAEIERLAKGVGVLYYYCFDFRIQAKA